MEVGTCSLILGVPQHARAGLHSTLGRRRELEKSAFLRRQILEWAILKAHDVKLPPQRTRRSFRGADRDVFVFNVSVVSVPALGQPSQEARAIGGKSGMAFGRARCRNECIPQSISMKNLIFTPA